MIFMTKLRAVFLHEQTVDMRLEIGIQGGKICNIKDFYANGHCTETSQKSFS
jgi:hypothetical protein